MAYVTFVWEGHPPQRPTMPSRNVPFQQCISELGLRESHYVGNVTLESHPISRNSMPSGNQKALQFT